MIEYYSNTNEQKSSIPKNGENIGSKCTISVVKDFIVISFLNDEIHCQINSYSINNEFKLAVTTTYIDVINLTHSNSNLFHCISLGINQNNIECFYIEKKDENSFTTLVKQKVKLDILKTETVNYNYNSIFDFHLSQVKITRTNDNNYIISLFSPDDYDNEYDIYPNQFIGTFILGNDGFEKGSYYDLISEDYPSSVQSYSGHFILATQYYGTYISGTSINVEKFTFNSGERDPIMAYDFQSDSIEFFNTFTYMYNNISVHIIATKNSESYLYIFDYPPNFNCTIGSMIALSGNQSKYNIKEGLAMQSTIGNIGMKDINFDSGLNPVINNSTYIATFTAPIKTTEYSPEFMLFSYLDNKETYFYNHDCNVLIYLCHPFCKECSTIPTNIYNISAHPTNCTVCANNYYEAYPGDCYLADDEVEGYYFSSTKFELCYETCKTCEKGGDINQMNCTTCKDDYVAVIYNSITYCLTCPETTGQFSYDPKIFGLTKRDVDKAKNGHNFNKEDFSNLVYKRTIIYFIVIIIITLFTWFYGMSFCAIFTKCQRNLVFYIFMTWLLIMLYPIPLCAFIALLRYLALKYHVKYLFKMSKALQWIIFF